MQPTPPRPPQGNPPPQGIRPPQGHMPPPPGPVIARPVAKTPARPVNPSLPTMADLDRLQGELDTIDQTLADLDLTTI